MKDVLKCPQCRNVMPRARPTKFISGDGLTDFMATVCEYCGTRVQVPVNDKTK